MTTRLSRRGRPLRLAAVGVALAALALTVPAAASAQRGAGRAAATRPTAVAARPNILFVLVDDMGFADLSATGNRKIATPNIDRLAAEGTMLTRFYDAAPICSPSRAGFFTGRFPAELGFVTYIDNRASNAAMGQADWLDPRLPNLARTLHDAGYATGHFGKWHMGGGRDIGDAPWPTAYGFDESLTTFEGLGPRVLVSDEERNLADQSAKLGQGAFFWEKKARLTQLYCDRTIDFVARHKDRPWFVQLWLNDVHDPWAPDNGALRAVAGKGADHADELYLASVAHMDAVLGDLFRRLDRMGEGRDTLIVFTSDNGPSSLPRYYRDGASAPGSVGALRGRKWSNYEGGIRQPLIVRWAGHARAGRRDTTTVAHGADLLPTLARAAGLRVPAGVDGIDLTPAVFGGHAIARRPPLFWAYGTAGATKQPPQPAVEHDRAPMYAVRDGRWKLLTDAAGTRVELYDLDADPNETTDRAATAPDVRRRLVARLDRWRTTLGGPATRSGGVQ